MFNVPARVFKQSEQISFSTSEILPLLLSFFIIILQIKLSVVGRGVRACVRATVWGENEI